MHNSKFMSIPGLVSIICPNYNKASFLEATLQAVLDQSYPHWELLLLDDGSTDSSLSIIHSFEQKDNRIHFLPRPEDRHYGGSGLRNLGLQAARGEFTLLLDSDDLITPFCLQQRIAWIQAQSPELHFAIFPMGTFYEQPGDRAIFWKPKVRENHLKLFLQHKLPWHTSSPLWQTSFLQQLQGFDPGFARLQDVELHTRALLHPSVCYAIAEEAKPDFYYRVSSSRAVYNGRYYAEAFLQSAFQYIEKISGLLKQTNKESLTPLLTGTAFEALHQGLNRIVREQWTKQEAQIFKNQFFTLLNESALHNAGLERRLRLFVKLHSMGAHRVRGFQRLSRWYIH